MSIIDNVIDTVTPNNLIFARSKIDLLKITIALCRGIVIRVSMRLIALCQWMSWNATAALNGGIATWVRRDAPSA